MERHAPTALSALLVLADGRFPAGGHAHSAGVEAAVALLGVGDIAALEDLIVGRLATTGRVETAFAATACHAVAIGAQELGWWDRLDRELDARIVAPSLRAASRALGRQLQRAATRVWAELDLVPLSPVVEGPHQAVCLGAVAGGLHVSPHDAAALAAHHLVATMVGAAVRLSGHDPYEAHAILGRCGARIDDLALTAAAGVEGWVAALETLPATSSPLADLLAAAHAGWDLRLFAS